MPDSVTIELESGLVHELDAFARQHGLTRSEVVVDAVRDYLFFHRSRSLRARMSPEAQAQGLFTDRDVMERIS